MTAKKWRACGLLTCLACGGPGCTVFPHSISLIFHTHYELKGSVSDLVALFFEKGALGAIASVWPAVTARGAMIVAAFGLFEAFLQLYLPGRIYKGPITPNGNVPTYVGNGLQAFTVTHVVLFALHFSGVFNLATVYDELGSILTTLNYFALLFCLALFIKGHVAPSSTDSGSSGNYMFDYYWGMELYPRLGKHFDLKFWTNCRVGMMGWSVLLNVYAIAQLERSGHIGNAMLISVILQQVYIAKFFWWESGYMSSIDIMHDRAGFYICWGCLVWVPCFYTSPTMYLVPHADDLPLAYAVPLFIFGLTMIFVNYWADAQRADVRATGGETTVFGKKPKLIRAKYTTAQGEEKTSLLLVSGFWAISRHFHYVPELLAALSWTVPQPNHLLPYAYFLFLVVLLFDRAVRDEGRCRAKYGKYYDQYVEQVPYKVIPYIF